MIVLRKFMIVCCSTFGQSTFCDDYRGVVIVRLGRNLKRSRNEPPPPSCRVFLEVAPSCDEGAVALFLRGYRWQASRRLEPAERSDDRPGTRAAADHDRVDPMPAGPRHDHARHLGGRDDRPRQHRAGDTERHPALVAAGIDPEHRHAAVTGT